jgi:hypothetical protein
MTTVKVYTEFTFVSDVSQKGTPIKYIQFLDNNFRLSNEQKSTLKLICHGYFFYSKLKKMWGFTDRGNNELNVYNFINEGCIPDDIVKNKIQDKVDLRSEPIPFSLADFEIFYVEERGRPLFFYQSVEGIFQIKINLAHWFFVHKSDAEKEFAKKIVLSLVGTELEFTSPIIDSFFIKFHSIQEILKYQYSNYG